MVTVNTRRNIAVSLLIVHGYCHADPVFPARDTFERGKGTQLIVWA